MIPWSFHFSLRMFLLTALGAGGLHYQLIAARTNRLNALTEQMKKHGTSVEEDGLPVTVERLNREVKEAVTALSTAKDSIAPPGRIAQILNAHGLSAPAIRAGQSQTLFGVNESRFDVQFKGSFSATASILDELSGRDSNWRLSKLSIEHGTDRDPKNLTILMHIRTYELPAGRAAE